MSEDQGVFVANTVFVDQTGAKVSDYWAGPQILYKYRQPSLRSLESLTLNQVWFAQPKTFNDPFESSKFMDVAAVEQMVRQACDAGGADEEGAARFVDVAIGREIDESGNFCLCRTADNIAMWSYYGTDENRVGLKGFAIGYDLVTLLRTLTPDPKRWDAGYEWRNRLVFDVAYRSELVLPNTHTLIDSVVEKKGLDFQKMHATKATNFAHEDEVRIVIPSHFVRGQANKGNERLSADGDNDRKEHWQPKWLGHGAYEHAHGAIREIVFGELIEPVHEEMIRKIMAGRDVVFKRAIRDPKTMGIVLEPDSGRNET